MTLIDGKSWFGPIEKPQELVARREMMELLPLHQQVEKMLREYGFDEDRLPDSWREKILELTAQ